MTLGGELLYTNGVPGKSKVQDIPDSGVSVEWPLFVVGRWSVEFGKNCSNVGGQLNMLIETSKGISGAPFKDRVCAEFPQAIKAKQ
jgi:hypothetical protein